MKKLAIRSAFSLMLLSLLTFAARGERYLIPVGEVIGMTLSDDTVIVAAFDDTASCGRDAGLKIGDDIVAIDGKTVDSIADVRELLAKSDGHIEIELQRGEKRKIVCLEPAISPDGPRLGVYLKEGISGIGTVTYYDPETGDFGSLGHGVSTAKGKLLTAASGRIFPAKVLSVDKGREGSPGQLKGSPDTSSLLGNKVKNTPQGVFGNTKNGWAGTAIPIAAFEEIAEGKASILSTVSGDAAQEYSVEILKIYPKDRPDSRNFLLKVTDPALLDATGGVVRGMSGSPIIQNGKLIGAVTHVLVNDPTTGYGIFIDNMLDAAA